MTRFDAALPPPTADALAASEALAARIAARLDAEGGWLGFDTYMAMALYEPALGLLTRVAAASSVRRGTSSPRPNSAGCSAPVWRGSARRGS